MDRFATDLHKLGGATPDSEDVIQGALMAIRNHLGMEVAYFSEFVDGRSVFRRVDAPGLEHLIKAGDSQSLDDVYCNHILEGRLPELIPDTAREPLAQAMPITRAVPIGSHISIPIRLPDGTPYGMFCCLSPRPNPSLNERDLSTMRVFAELAAKQVHAEIEERRAYRARRGAVETVIKERGFEMVYQPIFNLTSMSVIGYEALCRFAPEPYRAPDLWFGDAAAVGLDVDLELQVIETASAVFDVLPAGISLALNASPRTITSGRLQDSLRAKYLDRTILEITEHTRVENYDALHRTLSGLKSAGVKLALDDAGAGYSGLNRIVQLAPDIIKMDMSLTRGVDHDPARRALASAMIFYARETGTALVAEGIETAEELRVLQMLGVTRGQGYHLGRPGHIDRRAAPRSARQAS